ncbi:hypothetical protein WJX72_011414 [[Myrmecia] bisecta]|uniref:Attractin/MKLN-like beta-propeller domain-containing protein n=1 Tax=[Myrmecia] bisecta TaxID=41462 RepID=A0AAW1QGJ8_9CHLO
MQLHAAARLGLLLLLAASSCSPACCKVTWETVHPATAEATGGRNSPAIRYSHAAATYDKQMFISHGYYYDAATGEPKWLSDTWAMAMQPPYKWHKLHDGIAHADAVKAAQRKKPGKAPCGRYGATSVAYAGKLYLFGGTDGGHSKHGKPGYEQGYDLDELWSFDIKKRSWSPILNAKASPEWPAARYLHVAVPVGAQMLVYGGNAAELGDVWSFDFASRKWMLLIKTVEADVGGPGSLFAASAVPAGDGDGFLVFGGRRFRAKPSELSEHTWHFSVSRRQWQRLQSRPSGVPKVAVGGVPMDAQVTKRLLPVPRFYSAMANIAHANSIRDRLPMAIMAAGSIHTPTMECTDETWAVSWDLQQKVATWKKLPAMPYGIYYHSISVHGGVAFTFGGHLCSESKGDKPFYYLNTVHRLELQEFTLPVRDDKNPDRIHVDFDRELFHRRR